MKSFWLAPCYGLLSVVVMADVVFGFAMTRSSSTSPAVSLQQQRYSSTTTMAISTTPTTTTTSRAHESAWKHQREGVVSVAAETSHPTRTEKEGDVSLIREITSIPNFVSFLNQDEDEDGDGGSLCIVK